MTDVGVNEAKSYERAFEEAGRALDAQERAVNELRSRAGVLIAAAAITTSFFGSRAIVGAELCIWVWVAVAAFIVVGGCVLTVLWPRSDWSFNASASEIIAEYMSQNPSNSRSSNEILRCTDPPRRTPTLGSFGGCSWCSGSASSCWFSRSPPGSSLWRNGGRMRAMATKPAPAPPTAPPQPIKPSPMQGETRGGRNGDAK
jgi:hypothetical protein